MKYLRFIYKGEEYCGLLGKENRISLLSGGLLENHSRTGRHISLDQVETFLPPVDPPNIFALGKNYAAHAAEFGGGVPPEPVIFQKATTSLSAHGKMILLPRGLADEVDYEAELAVVIGRTARRVSCAVALDYVLGYTCANDVTQRRCQKQLDSQWTRAKGFDTFCPLGPWLETDLNPAASRVKCRVNGELVQDQPTSEMLWDVPRLIELLSACFTLLPGTVILTGTPAGVGAARTPPRYLRPGDEVEVEVEGVGTLRNRVAAE